MSRRVHLSAVVVVVAMAVTSRGRAAEEIDAAGFDDPTRITFDGLGFGELITDQFAGADFGGSLFGSPDGAAGPVAGNTVTVTFDTTQTRVGFEFFPGASVASVTVVFFRAGETEPTDSLPVNFSTGTKTFFGAEDPQGIDSVVLHLTASGAGGTLSLFDSFVFESVAESGPRIAVEPAAVDFADVLLGESPVETVSITNSGTEMLRVAAISEPGGDFSLTTPALPLTLGPGQSASFDIRYTPAEIGDDEATITIESDDPGGNVVVTARGSAVGVAAILVDPTALDFGVVLLGSSRTRSFTVTNPGTAPLEIAAISAPGGEFAIVLVAPGPLAAGASVEVAVSYSPSNLGADAATITVETDVGDVAVSLEGEGILSTSTIEVAPRNIDFGDVFVGSFTEAPITISNPGDAVLQISRISLRDGAAPPHGPFDLPLFSSDFPPGFPITVAPGASKSFMVRFTPADTVDSLDQIEIESNDLERPEVVVPLSGSGVAVLVPEIDVFPATLVFGGRFLDSTSRRMVTVRNNGTGNLVVTGVDLTRTSSSSFRLTGAPEEALTLEPGAALDVQILFTPAFAGPHNGILVVTSSDSDESEVRAVMSGVGVFQDKPEIEVEPLSIDFGEQFVGAESTRAVTVRNVGTLDLSVAGVEIGSGSSADFSVVGEPEFVLVPGGERTITVTFVPAGVAVVTGTLQLESSDADEPVTTVSIEGRGIPVPKPRITVRTPPTLLFSEVLVGTASTLRATIQNTGVANLNVTAIALGAETSPEFQITSGPAAVEIVPGAEVSIEVTYTPGNGGLDSGVLRIQSDDEIDPLVNVALLGIGVGDPVAEITVYTSTPTADFGRVEVGSPSALDVTILNSGTANLEVTGISLSVETGAEFLITGGPESLSIAPGAHVVVEVTYTPADAGFDSGTLVIESLDADESISTVALTGTGVPSPVQRIVAASPALEYGSVQIGASSALPFTVTNTGTANLDVRAIAITEGSSPAFSITDGPRRVNLAPGAGFTVEVTYRPTRATTDSGLLQIYSDDAETPVISVSLSGTGIAVPLPRIEVDPAALDFGDVAVGAHGVLGLTLRNTGTMNLAVTSIGLGEGSSAAFTITGGPPLVVLQPGGETSLEVTYSPAAAITDSGTLRLESNDVEHPAVVVSLSGAGLDDPAGRIRIEPAAVDFGKVDIGTESARSITIRNTGSAALFLSEIVLGKGSSGRFAISARPGGAQLDPGAETTLEITYTPSFPRADSASVRVASSDDRRPRVTVSLFGVGVGDAIEDIFKRADANQDGEVNIADPIATLMYLFSSGAPPTCFDAADSNDDSSVDLSDALFTLNHLFSGGGAAALGERCDTDPSPDDLPPCEYPSGVCD